MHPKWPLKWIKPENNNAVQAFLYVHHAWFKCIWIHSLVFNTSGIRTNLEDLKMLRPPKSAKNKVDRTTVLEELRTTTKPSSSIA